MVKGELGVKGEYGVALLRKLSQPWILGKLFQCVGKLRLSFCLVVVVFGLLNAWFAATADTLSRKRWKVGWVEGGNEWPVIAPVHWKEGSLVASWKMVREGRGGDRTRLLLVGVWWWFEEFILWWWLKFPGKMLTSHLTGRAREKRRTTILMSLFELSNFIRFLFFY